MTIRDDHPHTVIADFRKAKRAAEFGALRDGVIAFEAALDDLVAKAIADRLPPFHLARALEEQAKRLRQADRERRKAHRPL